MFTDIIGVCGKVVGPWMDRCEIFFFFFKVRIYYLNKRGCIIDNLMGIFANWLYKIEKVGFYANIEGKFYTY